MKNQNNNLVLVIEEEDLFVGDVSASTGNPLPNRADMAPQIFPGLARDEIRSSYYAISVWQTALLGSFAALAGWWLMENYFPNNPFVINPFGSFTGLYWLTNAIPAGLIGVFLGSLAGIKAQDWTKSLWGASQALALTLAGGAVGSLVAQLAYLSLESIQGDLYVLTLAQVLGWTILGLFIGLGQAIVSGNGMQMSYGIGGGLIGGLLGGLLFSLIESQIPGGIIARAAAYGLIGGSIGGAAGLADRQKLKRCR